VNSGRGPESIESNQSDTETDTGGLGSLASSAGPPAGEAAALPSTDESARSEPGAHRLESKYFAFDDQ
jgi:hypothetical protein